MHNICIFCKLYKDKKCTGDTDPCYYADLLNKISYCREKIIALKDENQYLQERLDWEREYSTRYEWDDDDWI